MSNGKKFWDDKHHEYAKESWINKPSKFSLWATNYFPKNGKILELGAGQGQDTRYFANLGYEVLSTDFSDTSLQYNNKHLPSNLSHKITISKLDLNNPFPFKNESFDVVYSHLAIHYFDLKTTQQIFKEIYRVLKNKGIAALLVNSITDPEYGTGNKLEEDYFEVKPNYQKRYFSTSTVKDFAKAFKIIVLDDLGLTHKDVFRGKSNLIRFIGEKD